MAFIPRGTLSTNAAPVLRSQIVTNSVAVVEQDSVKLASGFIALGTTGALVFGHVVGIVSKEGVGLNTTGVAGAAMGSFAGAYTVASDNQTVGQVKVMCDVSKMSLYSGEESATIGTTTGSNLAGYYQDISDEDTLKEDTAAATACQYLGWGVDPLLSTQAIVNIYESQVFGV